MPSGRAGSPGLRSRANDQPSASARRPGLMADRSVQRRPGRPERPGPQERPGSRRRGPLWRLIRALSSPDSYATVLLLILVTYALSTTLTASWAASLILAIQIATVWVSLRAARASRPVLVIADVALVVAAMAAAANLIFGDRIDGGSVVLWVSCLLYLAAPVAIVRHLLQRHVVDAETVLGAIAAYLMAGMFFAFLYHVVGVDQARPPFFGSHGPGTVSQDLFFSFTTLTTTGYGNLVPSGNPGQTFAVLEMVIGQLFLVVAVAKVVSAWRPGQGRAGLRKDSGDE